MSPARFDRAAALRRMEVETFDVLVIGGGVTGAGVALDAASRGLSTALVERHDFAAGTSSRSSKLVHGGIRYLEQGDVHLVYQALTERRALLRNAPHLVQTLAFVIPIFTKGGIIPRFLSRGFGLVLWLYDLTGGALGGLRHRRLGKDETLAHMPSLKPERVDHGYLYHDARVDDARLTLTVARTAALDHGAAVANYAPVVRLLKDASGKATGATVDTGNGTIDVRARTVVNAGGVWVDGVEAMDVPDQSPTMRPARGVHMVLRRSLFENDVAVILPIPGRKGSVFAIPWGDFTYVGTTDTDFAGPLDDLYCTGGEVDYLLGNINHNIQSPVTRDQVVGTWAGLRPLLASGTGKTADLSRRHRLIRSPNGVVTIAGGKLTTFRRMAEDTVDLVLRSLGRTGKCRTKSLPLRGAAGHDKVDDRGLGSAVRDHLVGRYGADASRLIDAIVADPSLGQPLLPDLPYLRAEMRYAAEHEMAQTLDDLLARRTRSRLLARDASADVAEEVADLVAGPLGWSPEDRDRELAAYRSSVEAERQALSAPFPDGLAERRPAGGWVPDVKLPRSLR